MPAAAWLAPPAVELFVAGMLETLLGLAVLLGQRLPGLAIVGLGIVAACLASLAFDPAAGLRDGLLLVLGGTLGLATATLLLWSLFDLLRRKDRRHRLCRRRLLDRRHRHHDHGVAKLSPHNAATRATNQ